VSHTFFFFIVTTQTASESSHLGYKFRHAKEQGCTTGC
jgi:hypothetical protein